MIWRKVFGLDVRSLAALRIGLAVMVLVDLIDRAQCLTAHYSDQGVLPRAGLLATFPNNFVFSLHMASGETWFQALLFLLQGFFALAMLLGYRTRLFTALTFVLLQSLQQRNPMICYKGDDVLRLAIFWSLFLPTGAVWSLDRRLGRATAGWSAHTASSVGAAGYLLQCGFIYLFTGIQKFGPEWRTDGTAVLCAVSAGQYECPSGQALRDFLTVHPGVERALTFGVLGWEYCVLFLLLIPGWGRALGALSIAVFQIGLAIFMALGFFPYFNLVSLLGLIPGGFWRLGPVQAVTDRLERWVGAGWTRLGVPAAPLPPEPVPEPAWRDSLASFALGSVLVLNLCTAPGVHVPRVITRLGTGLGLTQNWLMFAPSPPVVDNWGVARGVLADGREVDLFHRRPLTYERPAVVTREFIHYRWGMYFFRIYTHRSSRRQKELFCDALVRSWNLQGTPVREANLTAMQRPIQPFRGYGPVERLLLFQKSYGR